MTAAVGPAPATDAPLATSATSATSATTSPVSGIGTRVGRWALLFVWTTGLVQTWLHLDEYPSPPWVGVALVVTLVGMLAVSEPTDEPLPLPLGAVVALVPVVLVACVLWQVTPDQAGTTWFLEIGVYLATLLVIRGRVLLGWLGSGVALALVVGWAVRWHAPAGQVATILMLPVLALGVGTFWRLLLRRVVAQVTAHRAAEARLAVVEAATRAAEVERVDRLETVGALTRPLLERIARGGRLTEDERTACALLEAEVRDGLRAPALSVEPVVTAAREARRRGVDVLLLDDGGPQERGLETRFLDAAAQLVRTVPRGGRVTVRVVPPGRGVLGTVLLDDGTETTRVTFGADGAVQ